MFIEDGWPTVLDRVQGSCAASLWCMTCNGYVIRCSNPMSSNPSRDYHGAGSTLQTGFASIRPLGRSQPENAPHEADHCLSTSSVQDAESTTQVFMLNSSAIRGSVRRVDHTMPSHRVWLRERYGENVSLERLASTNCGAPDLGWTCLSALLPDTLWDGATRNGLRNGTSTSVGSHYTITTVWILIYRLSIPRTPSLCKSSNRRCSGAEPSQ